LLLSLTHARLGQPLLAALAAQLHLAGSLLARALEWAALDAANARLSRSEQLQRALFAIADQDSTK